jgi:DNA-binding response OmpR family regulator
MKKILLVFEDYSELATTEIYLKKVGFDVVGVTNESKMADQILTLNPDVVVAQGKGQRVSSLSVGQKLRENHKYHGKAILIFVDGHRPGAQDFLRVRMDALLEAPVEPLRMIQVLANLENLDGNALADKFKKAVLSDPALREKFQILESRAKGDAKKSVIQDHERVEKYKKFLKEPPADLQSTTFNKQDIKSRQRELKKDWDFNKLEEIDGLKRKFANALFKKS